MRNSLTTTTCALTGAVVAGVALGFATQALQGSLDGSSAVLANSGAVWIFVAFALGLVMPSPRVAGAGGALCLVAASISFYLAVDWFEGVSSAPRSTVIWSIVGIVAGSAFGLAGFLARNDARHRYSAWALLAGVLIGDGIHLAWNVGNDALRPAAIAELVVAAVTVTLSLRRSRSATLVIAITAAAAVVTLGAVSLINRVFIAV